MSAKHLRLPSLLLVGACVLFPAHTVRGQAQPQASEQATEEAIPEGLSRSDWTSIRATYEARRHVASAVEGGYEARNPGQAWRTHFDGRGFLTEPDAGEWTWGLELERYGFAGREREVTRPTRVSAEGGRVAYAWDAALTEWYENDTRGLEHGYTIHHRPDHEQNEASPLTFTLAV